MNRALRTAATGMYAQQLTVDVIANNLANVNTTGFKQDRFAFHRELAAGASAPAGSGASGGGVVQNSPAGVPQLVGKLDVSPGSFETTGSPLHLSISGPGFFAVQGPEGELYTRDGSLLRGADGTITTRSGYPLLTDGGTLTVSPSAALAFGADGTVYVDGSPQGKVKLVALPDASQITHAGSGLVRSAQPAQEDTVSRVVQGSLEGANVDPVSTMVQMTELLHDYQANQSALLTQDGSLGKLIQWASS